MLMDRLFLGVLADSATPATDPDRVSRAWVLFLVLAILLTVFVLGVALMTIAHRFRTRPEPQLTADDEDLSDPWQEAGKRATPLDGRGITPPESGDGADDEDIDDNSRPI
jgi:hypothetical protein